MSSNNRKVIIVTDNNLFNGDLVTNNSKGYTSVKSYCKHHKLSDTTYNKIIISLRKGKGRCIYENMYIYRLELI